MKQACFSSLQRSQLCSTSGNGHGLCWVLIKSHLSQFTSIGDSSPHLFSHHLLLYSFLQLLPGLASSNEPIKISISGAEGQADELQRSLAEMCGHLLIKHAVGQVPAVAGAAWGGRMRYGLTGPSEPLQAGHCGLVFIAPEHSFCDWEQSTDGFLTIGIHQCPCWSITHHM